MRASHHPMRRAFQFAALSWVAAGLGMAAPAGVRPSQKPSKNIPFNIQIQQNVVQVPVVVHDALGKPVPNLTKKDFILLDNGKPQLIGYFTVDDAKALAEALTPPRKGRKKRKARSNGGNDLPPGLIASLAEGQVVPTRFVALLFDDGDMKFSQLARTVAAAKRFIETSLASGDRVALYTTSGKEQLDFTSDRATLHDAIRRLQHENPFTPQSIRCPALTDYEAFLIADQDNQNALAVATQQVIDCQCGGDSTHCHRPAEEAKIAARSDWAEAEERSHFTVVDLDGMVERLESVPGQRSIVFISPGFNWWEEKQAIDDVINRALRSHIIVNTLDARGLWVMVPNGAASHPGNRLNGEPPSCSPGAQTGQSPAGCTTQGSRLTMGSQGQTAYPAGAMDAMRNASEHLDSGILEAVAEGTGGFWFHDNNDLNEGFTEAGGLPQTTYVLAFSPSDLEANGKYHQLKVSLASGVAHRGWTIQARKGYYAPNGKLTSAEQIHQQIKQAVFSQTEVAGLPIHVEASSVKSPSNPTQSELTVTLKLNASALHFSAQAGKNVDEITFVTAVFDINGDFVSGKQRTAKFALTDPSLKAVQAHGILVPMHFKLAPGIYLLRVVVRDADGALAAQSVKAALPSL